VKKEHSISADERCDAESDGFGGVEDADNLSDEEFAKVWKEAVWQPGCSQWER
jgi:hypothetical protein